MTCELCGTGQGTWYHLQPEEAESLDRPGVVPYQRFLCQRCHDAVKGWMKYLEARKEEATA